MAHLTNSIPEINGLHGVTIAFPKKYQNGFQIKIHYRKQKLDWLTRCDGDHRSFSPEVKSSVTLNYCIQKPVPTYLHFPWLFYDLPSDTFYLPFAIKDLEAGAKHDFHHQRLDLVNSLYHI